MQVRKFAVAVYARSLIFLLGGHEKSVASVLVFVYDTYADEWAEFPSLNFARHSHSAIALSDNLFAFGGRDDEFNLLGSIECLKVGSDSKWNLIVN